MKNTFNTVKKCIAIQSDANTQYKKLRKHLHRQPIGYPATFFGTEIRLLKEIYTIEEVEIALCLDYTFTSIEVLYDKSELFKEYGEERFREIVGNMEKKGGVFVKKVDNEKKYALHPFILGMFEMQVASITTGFFLDTFKYVTEGFVGEYITSALPQTRVIPVKKSVGVEHAIATYDEIRQVVIAAGERICIVDCICKNGKDLIGDPCKVTKRRHICFAMREFGDMMIQNGIGQKISVKEALNVLEQNEKDGLVLMLSTMLEPQVICSCCSCCCGVLTMIGGWGRPADFVASNYYTTLNVESCIGCGMCVRRCPMGAIIYIPKKKKAKKVDHKRCIGCGLCVATCKTGSLRLEKKSEQFVPPRDHEGLMTYLMENKKNTPAKYWAMMKAFVGIRI